jgi:asparagine synthase (glutamine-hydrolysing)
MCRISGIIDFNASIGYDFHDIAVKMRDSMAYGGPDGKGEFMDGQRNLYLGHRRLAVIDISSAGNQPMIIKDLVIVFNGEIYNYAEISAKLVEKGYHFDSNSDTEVILKAFDCWGYDAVSYFRGMFSFALWNRQTKKLLLCRDRLGVKPMYWYFKDGVFLFGSELKSLCFYPRFDKTINDKAVSLFLQTGYIKSPHSIFSYAHKLEPGGFLEIDEHGEIRTWKYWNVNDISPLDEKTDDATVLKNAEVLLTESCIYRMVADVPVGIFLSGGIDSSLITALLQKEFSSSMKTFTIGFEDKDFDESVHAKKIAEFLGTNHHELICTPSDFERIIPLLPDMYDEPFGDSSAIPTHLVSTLAREQVTVALSADGGDEVFSGYRKYKALKDYYYKIRHLPMAARKKMAEGLLRINQSNVENVFRRLSIPYDFKGLQWRLPKLANALSATDEINFFELASLNISHEKLRSLHSSPLIKIFDYTNKDIVADHLYSLLGMIDINTYLEGDILTKVDRASMAVALEAREPLLDHKLIEFGLSLPDRYKIRNGQSKWILRNILYKYVPKELVERPKQGFAIPIKEWLKNGLKNSLLELSEDEKFCATFKLQREELKTTINLFLNFEYTNVNPHFVWFLYSLYMWYKRWL